MAEDAKEDAAVAGEAAGNKAAGTDARKKQRSGILSRIWRGIFRGSDDFEKMLQYLSKEEASVHARIKRRAQRWRSTARNIIVFSVVLEVSSLLLWWSVFNLEVSWRLTEMPLEHFRE